jgi:type IV secretion system protein TrbF
VIQELTPASDGARYRRAKDEWDERWGNLAAGKESWKLCAFLALFVALCAVCWAGYLGRLPKTVLYVVERDQVGRVAYAGPAKPSSMDDRTWDLIKVQSLRDFVQEWRTVTTDKTAQDALWDHAYLHIGSGSSAKKVLDEWYATHSPNQRAASEIVTVDYRSFYPRGANTFGIWWTETTRSITGEIRSQKNWQGTFTYAAHLPSADAARAENPLGILITELSFEEVL